MRDNASGSHGKQYGNATTSVEYDLGGTIWAARASPSSRASCSSMDGPASQCCQQDFDAQQKGGSTKQETKMLKRLLLTTALLAPLPAQASTITVFATNSYGGGVLAYSEIFGYSTVLATGPDGLPVSGGVVSAFHSGNSYELA